MTGKYVLHATFDVRMYPFYGHFNAYMAGKMTFLLLCTMSSCSDEDVTKEEHLDNDFLWNLKMLSEVRQSLSSTNNCPVWCLAWHNCCLHWPMVTTALPGEPLSQDNCPVREVVKERLLVAPRGEQCIHYMDTPVYIPIINCVGGMF